MSKSHLGCVFALVLCLVFRTVNAFRPAAAAWSALRSLPGDHVETISRSIQPDEKVKDLCQTALQDPGSTECLQALEQLGAKCAERQPYNFDHESSSNVERLSQLIPTPVAKQVFDIMNEMMKRGWISTNPDSVDGLPSFHLNLVSQGRPVAEDLRADDDEFAQKLDQLTQLVSAPIYDCLLPRAREMIQSSDLQVSDIFLRRYGNKNRRGISAHYDVVSHITAVVALDDTARDGRNGLYTTVANSNHAALRRFFPLASGDAVLHTWKILHGVDVEPGLERTSLIVWFSASTTTSSGDHPAPWIANESNLAVDPVAQFVSASGLESSAEVNSDEQDTHDSSSNNSNDPVQLYLQSAAGGNVFAWTRLGSLCESGSLADEQRQQLLTLLDRLEDDTLQLGDDWNELAQQCWWQGARGGNPNAQVALADEIMTEIMSVDKHHHDDDNRQLLLASVLFGLAAQQGHEHALDSLQRVIQIDASIQGVSDVQKLSTYAIAVAATASLLDD